MIVVTVDKQTGSVVGRPEIITRGFVHLNERDPIMDEALERVIKSIQTPGDHISEIAPAQDPDQGRRVALPVRADEATADGLPGRGRGLTNGYPRPNAGPQDARAARPVRAARKSTWATRLTPEVVRSIVGLVAARARGDDPDRAGVARGRDADRRGGRTSSRRGSGPTRWLLPFVLLGRRLVPRGGRASPNRAGG